MNLNFLSNKGLNYLCPYSNLILLGEKDYNNEFDIQLIPNKNIKVNITLAFLKNGIRYTVHYHNSETKYHYHSNLNLIIYDNCFTHELYPTFIGFDLLCDIAERDFIDCKLYLDLQNPNYVDFLLNSQKQAIA